MYDIHVVLAFANLLVCNKFNIKLNTVYLHFLDDRSGGAVEAFRKWFP